jgi:uncharacterized protein (DUF488 family)
MSALFTIGYEGTDIDRFVRTLKAAGVRQLADVRAVPVSRKAGFSKTMLAARLAEDDIGYLPFTALGNPKAGRDAGRAGDLDQFRSIFGAHIQTDTAQNALRDLAVAARTAPTCLLCFERDPKACHRSIIAQEVAESVGFGVVDLVADSPGRSARTSPPPASGNGHPPQIDDLFQRRGDAR